MVALACATSALSCASNGKSDDARGGADGSGNAGGSTASGGSAATAGAGGGSAGATTSGTAGSAGAGNAAGAGPGTGGSAGAGTVGSAGSAPAGGAGSGGAAAVGSGGAGGRGGAGGGQAGASGSAGAGGAQWQSAFPTFAKHTIASFSSGYSMLLADIDHDGKPDVVAVSSASAGIVWFKNPAWTKYTVTTKPKQLLFAAPHDVDGDGDVDLAFISDFDMSNTMGGGTVSWAENPDNPTQMQDWTVRKIDAIPTAHRVRWADLDGDGKKELIVLPIFGVGSKSPSHAGAVQLKAFTVPKDPKAAGAAWAAQTLDDQHLETAHALEVVDWDGDKAQDLLTAANDGVDLFRPSLGKGAEHLADGATGQAPDKGSSEVGLGSLGGARFVATIEPWHGTDAVVYMPGTTSTTLWTRTVLGRDFEHGHAFAVADLNGDGYDEVIGGGGQGDMLELIYRYVPSSRTWEKIKLDMGSVAISGMEVMDMNGDGALDIVAIGGSPTNNVVWYESSR